MLISRSRNMHHQSSPLTIGGTVLKEYDDLVILGVTFDCKMTFERHLRSISRATVQRLSMLRKSWRVFHDRSLLGRCFRAFVLPVLEYCSAVWCSAADTHLKLLDHAVSGDRFLTKGVFECDIALLRSVAVLCMLYKIRRNPLHNLIWSLPGPYVPVRVALGALVAHRYIYSPPHCRTSHYHRTFIPLQCLSGTIFLTPLRWCGTIGFQEQGQCFLIGLSCSIPTVVFYYFPLSLLSVYRLVLWSWGLRTDSMYITLSQPYTADLFKIIIIIIIIGYRRTRTFSGLRNMLHNLEANGLYVYTKAGQLVYCTYFEITH